MKITKETTITPDWEYNMIACNLSVGFCCFQCMTLQTSLRRKKKKKKKASVTTNTDKHTDNFTVLTPDTTECTSFHYILLNNSKYIYVLFNCNSRCVIVPKIKCMIDKQ